MAKPAYADAAYRRGRTRLLAAGPTCAHCQRRPATEADHDPPLAVHVHRSGSGCCRLVPSCSPCARRQGAMIAAKVAPRPASASAPPSPAGVDLEPVGWHAADEVWAVPWLADLVDVPDDATWPRLMTPPHPAAVGSYGAELAAYALARTGRPLRWWQRLAAVRALEHDAAGALCWDAVDITVARQVGKSYLFREWCLWRLLQGDRFGEPQTIVHTGKDLAICVEIQRTARRWARSDAERFKVRDANGTESIELLADGSRWMVRSKDSVYGLSASMAVVDEAWAVPATVIEEGLVPTMVELASAQLVNVSTAHRRASALMLNRRIAALADLASTASDLWLEWSAPPMADLDDEDGWRAASPHWSERRRRHIANRLTAARSGQTDDDDEPDPLAAFVSQWLNRWPPKRVRAGPGEPLLDPDVWAACTGRLPATTDPALVALEDWFGHGAAVAYVAGDGAGRWEVGGEQCAAWADALALARQFALARPGARLVVGANMRDQIPADFPNRAAMRGAGQSETHRALPLLRALVAAGHLVHDVDTVDLDAQIAACRVRQLPAGGLGIVSGARSDVLRAALWALEAAQTPPPAPRID